MDFWVIERLGFDLFLDKKEIVLVKFCQKVQKKILDKRRLFMLYYSRIICLQIFATDGSEWETTGERELLISADRLGTLGS